MHDDDSHWFPLIDFAIGLFQLVVAAIALVVIVYIAELVL